MNDEDKIDFAEFLEQKKEDKEIEDSWTGSDPFMGFITTSWEKLSKKQFPAIRWRIKNLIPMEGFVILSSIAGIGKTWVALDMARCIVQGINYLNSEEFKTEGANVLYINAENSEAEIQRRGKQLNFDAEQKHKLHFLNDGDLNLNDDAGVIKLLLLIEYLEVKVVIVDTFRAVAGSLKEDKSEEVRPFFNRFNELKNKGVVVIWLMHLRKPTHFEGKTPKKEQLLGSQDKAASVEVLLMIHSEARSGIINMYQTKNRLAPEIAPFEIGMRDETDIDGKTKTSFSYSGTIKDEENKKEEAKELVLSLLSTVNGYTSGEILELTKKEVGQKNVRGALKELAAEGMLDTSKVGKQNYYFLPKEAKNSENYGNETLLQEEKDPFFDSS